MQLFTTLLLGISLLTTVRTEVDVNAIAKGNNQFGFELLQKLDQNDENLAFSPASLSTALAMTYAGAKGETADQMAATLHFALPPDQLHPAFGAWIQGLQKPEGPYVLTIANALWAQQDEPFLPDFLELERKHYGAGVHPMDFGSADARETINAWVEQNTAGKIKNLLQPPHPGPNTVMVLTNAVYFNGTWGQPFSKAATRNAPFHMAGGQSLPVPLMHQTGRFGYAAGDGYQAVELMYKGGDLSMVVLLPDQAAALADFEARLTADRLAEILGGLKPAEVNLMLPRFRVEAAVELQQTLGAMGMPLAFEGDADFSGMNGKGDLFLSAVIHKAFVDVNEEGTEAAAATGVVVARAMAVAEPPKVFRADHPFLFLIRDRNSGAILFLGHVVRPSNG